MEITGSLRRLRRDRRVGPRGLVGPNDKVSRWRFGEAGEQAYPVVDVGSGDKSLSFAIQAMTDSDNVTRLRDDERGVRGQEMALRRCILLQ